MSHYLYLIGRSITEEDHINNNLVLLHSQEISIACTALQAIKSMKIVEKYRLKTLSAPAPEECYPFPGERGCRIFWKPPGIFVEESLRFINYLDDGVEKEQRKTFIKSEIEWNNWRKSPISDEELDDLLLQMRKGFMNMADVATRMEKLGEDLAILVFG